MFFSRQLVILPYPMVTLAAKNRENKQISTAIYNSLKIQIREQIYCCTFSVKEGYHRLTNTEKYAIFIPFSD
jgi:hypothetical protein